MNAMTADIQTGEGRGLVRMDKVQFITAGRAIFTIVNEATGNRFTYKVATPKGADPADKTKPRFACLMTGPDNETCYEMFGLLRWNDTDRSWAFSPWSKSRMSQDAPGVKAFSWFFKRLVGGLEIPPTVRMYHEGACCRCGRRLTVPESIEKGIGPECEGRM